MDSHSQQEQASYFALESLIKKRQAFEHENNQPPYNVFKTTVDFKDVTGNTLLHYAIKMGDIEKVKTCITEGANINLASEDGYGLQLALDNGHLEIAKYLYDNGASCEEVNSYNIKDHACREWFHSLIKEALDESFPTHNINMLEPESENRFFKKDASNTRPASILRAIEIGDLNFMEDLLSYHNFRLYGYTTDSETRESLVTLAAKSGELEIVKFLMRWFSANPDYEFGETALMASIQYNHPEITEYLLYSDADVNRQNVLKRNALMYAIQARNITLVDTLLKKNINTSQQDFNGDTLFHHAVRTGNINLIKYLQNNIDNPNLINQENIYGHKPIDIAIMNKSDAIINLIDEHADKSEYGKTPINIAQYYVRNKLHYFMTNQYRNMEYFSDEGKCNGLGFLFNYYASKGMEKYFYDTLALIAAWDGSESALEKPLGNIPQAEYYNNLGELLEQWLNDIIWFQSLETKNLLSITQVERPKQIEVIKKGSEETKLEYIYKDATIQNHSHEQMIEILTYLSRMPDGIQIGLYWEEHVSAASIKNNRLIYYDPNFKFTLKQSNLNTITTCMLNYIQANFGEITPKSCIQTFYLEHNQKKLDLSNFDVFQEGEFPSTKSPNELTPLHIAVMTKSLKAIENIIAKGNYDIHALDKNGNPAMKIAIENDFTDAVKIMLQTPNIRPDFLKLMMLYACKNRNIDILFDSFIEHPALSNIQDLLKFSCFNEAYILTRKIIESGKLDTNAINYKLYNRDDKDFIKALINKTPLTDVIDDIDLMQMLIASGEKVTPEAMELSLNASYPKPTRDMLLFENYTFDLKNDADKKLLFKFLVKFANESDEDFIKILKSCNKEIVNFKLENGTSLLLQLLMHKQIKKIAPLLEAGMYPDAPLATNTTILMALIKEKNYPEKHRIIELLLKNGANPEIKNNDGLSAIDFLNESPDKSISKLFMAAGVKKELLSPGNSSSDEEDNIVRPKNV